MTPMSPAPVTPMHERLERIAPTAAWLLVAAAALVVLSGFAFLGTYPDDLFEGMGRFSKVVFLAQMGSLPTGLLLLATGSVCASAPTDRRAPARVAIVLAAGLACLDVLAAMIVAFAQPTEMGAGFIDNRLGMTASYLSGALAQTAAYVVARAVIADGS